MKRIVISLVIILAAALSAQAQEGINNPGASGFQVGTSGAKVPLLNGTNTWSGTQTFGFIDAATVGSASFLGNIASIGGGTDLEIANRNASPVATKYLLYQPSSGATILNGFASLMFAIAGSGVMDYGVTTASTWSSASPFTLSSATVKLTGVTTGTNADFLCLSATGVVLIQASACTISSMRFKENISPYSGDALATVAKLNPVAFNMKQGDRQNLDRNYARRQIGLIAENVAKVDPRLAIYEDDGVTPKSYRQESIIAVLIGAVQELKADNDNLRADVRRLERR